MIEKHECDFCKGSCECGLKQENYKSLSIRDDCEIKQPSKITCHTGTTWFLEMSDRGIKFNHEDFPESKPDDFARAFMELMEKEYAIKFIKKTECKADLHGN